MEEISFEEAFRRLETIVSTLESGRGELEESLAKYEEGIRLLRRCRRILDGAERRVEILKGIAENGAPILEAADENALRSQTDVAGRQTPPANAPKKNATATTVPLSQASRSKPFCDAPAQNAAIPGAPPFSPPTAEFETPTSDFAPPILESPAAPRRVVRRTIVKTAEAAPPPPEKTPLKRPDPPPRNRSFFDDEPPF